MAVLALDGFTWGVLGEVSARPDVDPHTIQIALHDVQQSNWSLPYYLTPLAFIAGLLVLATAAVRGRLVLLAGGVAVAVPLARA